jgi:putative transcriptional regulator
MNDKEFAELTESIKQAGEIKRGLRQPSRVFEFSPLDIKDIRAKLDKSQREFALMIGVSLGTLAELGARTPQAGRAGARPCCVSLLRKPRGV